jgi:hypothetical protein
MGEILIKLISITINNIYPILVYLKWYFSNYLVINGKYPSYHLLGGETFGLINPNESRMDGFPLIKMCGKD